jgi:CheY-like chemotaxis protein
MDPKPLIIMTVDDESSVRRVIRTVLERDGFTVLEASSGPEAIELAKHEPQIAMVLSDMRMPGMDGNALAHQLRALRPNVPLIFVSAFDSDVDECFRHCPTLPKPFNGKQLLARVRSQLSYTAQA